MSVCMCELLGTICLKKKKSLEILEFGGTWRLLDWL